MCHWVICLRRFGKRAGHLFTGLNVEKTYLDFSKRVHYVVTKRLETKDPLTRCHDPVTRRHIPEEQESQLHGCGGKTKN